MAVNQPILDPEAIARLRELGLAEEMIASFRREAPVQLEALDAASSRGDARTMTSAAHELRSLASNLGLERLTAFCDMVQQRGAAGSVAGISGMIADLRRELGLADAALEQHSR
jgi:HPt (histidine-containing phosphotransfer) domain-containing protein